LAEVHAELILVHPFRDGNGRLARLVALLMALQAGLPPLDFSPMAGRGKRVYIAAFTRHSRGIEPQLRAADCDDGARYRSLEATCRFQWAINAFVLAGGDFMPFPLENGARMPSTADDD
jgi:hypothetical protein